MNWMSDKDSDPHAWILSNKNSLQCVEQRLGQNFCNNPFSLSNMVTLQTITTNLTYQFRTTNSRRPWRTWPLCAGSNSTLQISSKISLPTKIDLLGRTVCPRSLGLLFLKWPYYLYVYFIIHSYIVTDNIDWWCAWNRQKEYCIIMNKSLKKWPYNEGQ